MPRLIRIGYSLVAIMLLVLSLVCGLSAVAVHQRIIPPPRVSVQLAGYRVTGSPVTIRSKPPKYYYSVWLFVTNYYPGSALRTEKGEQIMLLPLRAR